MKAGSVFSLLLIVASADVLAAGYSSGVNIATVETVDSTGIARVFLTFDVRPHVTTCSLDNPTQAYWRLGGNAENQKNMLMIAAAAKLAERPVKVLFLEAYSGTTACDAGGSSGYPVISGLIML